MLADQRIQETWRRMLGTESFARGIQAEKIEEGYYAVVIPAAPEQASGRLCGVSDYQLLEPLIPNLSRTRAVNLNAGGAYSLSDVEVLRDWAGDLAVAVEDGRVRAFAVVDLAVFDAHVRAQFAGWSVAAAGHDLEISDGRFKARFNLLRSVVRMVLSRSSLTEAMRTLREEVQVQFGVDDQLFARFERQFSEYTPAVLDHYFAAYPAASCVAAGWDYWQVAGKPGPEAERAFEEAMKEFATFLEVPSEGRRPWFGASACEGASIEN